MQIRARYLGTFAKIRKRDGTPFFSHSFGVLAGADRGVFSLASTNHILENAEVGDQFAISGYDLSPAVSETGEQIMTEPKDPRFAPEPVFNASIALAEPTELKFLGKGDPVVVGLPVRAPRTHAPVAQA